MGISEEFSFIVTIRSTGERTEKACIRSLLKEGIRESQINLIREAPFKKSLETCFQTAYKAQTKWLLTVDADMIIIPGTLRGFFQMAEEMPEQNLQIQGNNLDKFFASVRSGGPRIYRVDYLRTAYEISKNLPDNIRPESNVISELGEKEHPSRYISTVNCIHDFGQYYSDIYRKSYAHSIKHIKKLPKILQNTADKRAIDPDYKVFIKGIFDSLLSDIDVSIDKRILKDETAQALQQLHISEKKDIPESIDVQKIIKEYSLLDQWISYENCRIKDVPRTPTRLISENLKKKGNIKGIMYLFGLTLSRAGEYLQRVGK
ncbi:hypothetical protein [Rhodohalobacter sulfatireducens]|uniref:Glycosyltransferase 2-like domain-containing protein n=1 Tax=Rhodohalobacter sulfatireducens TaxID=2911366 RepID=A0ABS9KIW1_9BACT|nr:hypothetical protein [Rhodohalobacter sulfatireducens]MCG2590800.1 hypothetical protein [Rhodohalobacter sulfatireducens]